MRIEVMREDDWTPAKLVQHRAWREKMFRVERKPIAPKIVEDPERSVLECKVRELETELETLRTEIVEARKHSDLEAISATNAAVEETSAPVEEVHDRIIHVERIIRIVARYYRVTVLDMKSDRRTAGVVRPRQVAMYLSRMLTLRSLPDIGRRFGGRDHTTIHHGVRKISELLLEDACLCQEVAELEGLLAI